MTMNRRNLLRGAAVGSAVVLTAAVAETAVDGADRTAGVRTSYDFEGAHQAGILQPRQAAAAFLAMDGVVDSKAELAEAMRALTDQARFLTSGGTPPQMGNTAPPADSGVLGPDVPTSGLTMTFGFGSSMFDERFGLADQKPARLRPMDTFEDDNLDPARCHGDVLVQVCAETQDAVLHALRDLTRHTRGALQPRWRIDGFASPPRPDGTPRNLMASGTAPPIPTSTMPRRWTASSGLALASPPGRTAGPTR